MNSKKTYFGLIGLLILLGVSFVAIAYVGNQMLTKESAKLVTKKLDSKLLEEQQAALIQANKDIEKYSELNEVAQSVVPKDKDQAEAVREIYKIANDNNIKISSIVFPSSTLGQLVPKPAATTSEEGSSTSTPSTTQPSTSITQVKPVQGIPGVYAMEITVQQDSGNPTTYNNFIKFLSQLEKNRRTAHVTSVTVSPFPQDRDQLTFSLIANLYIKP